MSAARETVMKRLEELSIKYKVTEHEAVFTISQMEKLGICLLYTSPSPRD